MSGDKSSGEQKVIDKAYGSSTEYKKVAEWSTLGAEESSGTMEYTGSRGKFRDNGVHWEQRKVQGQWCTLGAEESSGTMEYTGSYYYY